MNCIIANLTDILVIEFDTVETTYKKTKNIKAQAM